MGSICIRVGFPAVADFVFQGGCGVILVAIDGDGAGHEGAENLECTALPP